MIHLIRDPQDCGVRGIEVSVMPGCHCTPRGHVVWGRGPTCRKVVILPAGSLEGKTAKHSAVLQQQCVSRYYLVESPTAPVTWAAGAATPREPASFLSRMPTRSAPPPPPDASNPSRDERLALFTTCSTAHSMPLSTSTPSAVFTAWHAHAFIGAAPGQFQQLVGDGCRLPKWSCPWKWSCIMLQNI